MKVAWFLLSGVTALVFRCPGLTADESFDLRVDDSGDEFVVAAKVTNVLRATYTKEPFHRKTHVVSSRIFTRRKKEEVGMR